MQGLSDRTVILAMVLTLFLVFGLIFTTRAPDRSGPAHLLWRDQAPAVPSAPESSGTLRI
ncbi:hypothetical protein [Synechococcus sp. CC9616]|uniref:hypothetical protein n=1 Tax=Synechococcus sp. CC9616 TaxID=110663 RepID=UPI00048FA8FA|nr:hypothetical protein [Synechococcus sp. CC9616]